MVTKTFFIFQKLCWTRTEPGVPRPTAKPFATSAHRQTSTDQVCLTFKNFVYQLKRSFIIRSWFDECTSKYLFILLNCFPVEVKCPSCQKEFCSLCSATWHPSKTCEENGKALVKRAGTSASLSGMFGSSGGDAVLVIGGIEIKRCPMCQVPIERDTGCAQMMCKRCKHVFCWYCLHSLDVSWKLINSFLLIDRV